MKHQIDSDGYVLVFIPDHHRAYKSGPFKGYVAEHIVVAEKMLGRSLHAQECVHHLDRDKVHNVHTNLLVLENSQHVKLHSWLDKNFVTKKPEFYNRITKSFSKTSANENEYTRCKVCGIAISTEQTYCSTECCAIGRRRKERPDSDSLGKDIVTMPMVKVAEKYGVSDNAIRKWCRTLGIPCKLCEIK